MSILKNKKYVCFGDSITSDEVTGTGTKIAELSGMKLIKNFAHGNATTSDWHDGDNILTNPNLELPENMWFADNTLSNQVREFLDMNNGENTPDIVYIAIGTNDGKLEECGDMTPVFDDCDAVFEQEHTQLTKIGIASALRWAIEEIKKACPKAEIYAASPLQNCWEIEANAFSDAAIRQKREIIRKVCDFCRVNFIDSYAESEYTAEIAASHGDGLHPDEEYRDKNAQFIIKKIEKLQNK